MKNLAIPLAACAIAVSIPSLTQAREDTVMCTLQYQPVCGMKDGAYRTFGNSCALGAEKATFVHEGECSQGGYAPSPAYVPPATCTAWFDGCNSCSKGPDGMSACTERACAGKPAAGYCTAYAGSPAVPQPLPDAGSVSSPVLGESASGGAEVSVEATTTEEENVGFFSRMWRSFTVWVSAWF